METEFILDMIVICILLRIAYIDRKTMEIPDKWIAILGICSFISWMWNREINLPDRMAGLFIVSVPMYLFCMVIQDAFGGGDIKLLGVMGFYLGWKCLLVGTYFGFLFGGLQAICLIVKGNVQRGDRAHMAFGPSLCVGMIIAMLWGFEIWQWYFG